MKLYEPFSQHQVFTGLLGHQCNVQFQNFLLWNWTERIATYEIATSKFWTSCAAAQFQYAESCIFAFRLGRNATFWTTLYIPSVEVDV